MCAWRRVSERVCAGMRSHVHALALPAAALALTAGIATHTASTGEAAHPPLPISKRARTEWKYKPVPNPRRWLRTAKDGDDADLRKHVGVDGKRAFAKLENMIIFSGSSNTALADEIAYELHAQLGKVDVSRFADGEVGVHVQDNVRGRDVYIVQSTSQPVNENIIELLLLISTMRRASARTITAIIPYYGYKRDVGAVSSLTHQLRQVSSLDSEVVKGVKSELLMQASSDADRSALLRTGGAAEATEPAVSPGQSVFPVSAADIAVMLEAVGVDRIVSVELQPPGQGHIEGFFPSTISVENLRSTSVAVEHLAKLRLKNPVVVAPNESCIQLANDIASGMSMKLDRHVGIAAMVEAGPSRGSDRYVHRQVAPAEGGAKESRIELVGDVAGHDVIVVDDMIDTGFTLMRRLQVLKERGASSMVAFATHGLFNGNALQRITKSPLAQVIVTNTVPLRDDVDMRHTHKIAQLSVAPIVAEAVLRIQTDQSLEPLRIYDRDAPVVPRYLGQE